MSFNFALSRLLLLGGLPLPLVSATAIDAPTCSAQDSLDKADPALERIEYDIGYGPEVFDAYVQPDVATFYMQPPGTTKAVKPKFDGLAGKFVNMSPEPLRLYWDPGNGKAGSVIGSCDPFEACGTATFPSHQFYFSHADSPDEKVARFVVEAGKSAYYYDPYDVPGDDRLTLRNLQSLSFDDYQRYEKHARSRAFGDAYKERTGREYLAMYARDKPMNFMWHADFIGQEHWATTRETHFVDLPPEEKLGKITAYGKSRILADDVPRSLKEYRDTERTQMNMTLKVLSCAPRAFEIRNFLSSVEVDHIIKLATGMDLKVSVTGDGPTKTDDRKVRTSRNSWVAREESPIVDAIYRRAADLVNIDEALMRYRGDGEYSGLGTDRSIAESLQLVHYGVGQEYTAHHDFGYRTLNDPKQEARFLTLLLYLNEGMKGGETSFPRWVNAETSDALMVTPEVGKAVLFYSQLPDGNLDDVSQHAAIPIEQGEKWLINLWVHDPIYEY